MLNTDKKLNNRTVKSDLFQEIKFGSSRNLNIKKKLNLKI